MKKVLIVEDSFPIQKLYAEIFGGIIEIIHAFSIQEAEEKFSSNSPFDAIVFDGQISEKANGLMSNSLELIKKIRTQFAGPMIASSNNPFLKKEMMDAGCNYAALSKNKLPDFLIEILDL